MPFLRRAVPLLVALACFAAPAFAQTVIERDFAFPPDRVALTPRGELTEIGAKGAMPELRPGRPDVPWLPMRVELPAGMRVTRTEVVSLETEPLAARVTLPSSRKVEPGLGPVIRTEQDPRWFGRAGFQPENPVELGAQGDARGTSVAALAICPVRWDPKSGRLERVRSIRVRLTLAPSAEPALVRERVVPEWEDGFGGAPSANRTLASTRVLRTERSAPAPFRATQLPSVLGSPVEYVIITDDAQAAVYQQLADWKTQSGMPAVVRTLSFIQQQYPYGADDAERIRLFLRDAYTRWGTKFALLGGDTDVLPTRFPFTRFYDGNYIASDLYYSCLDGNWNADGDSIYGEGFTDSNDPGDNCDLYPEIYVGRAPTLNATDAQQFVNKTFQYEKNPVGDYETNLLFFAEVLFPQNWSPDQATSLDGAELVEEVLPEVQVNPSMHYARLYENYLDPRWEPGALRETRQAVLDSLNKGYGIAVHVGHGYRNVMSVGDNNLTNQDASTLTNGNRLINLYAINCTSNAIDFPSIGEAFVKAPNGGAVSNIGSTNLDFPTAGRAYQTEYFRLVFEDSLTAIGEAQALSKVPFVGFSTYDGVNRWTQMTLLLLGDPELRIWTGTPRSLAVFHPVSIAASETTLTVQVQVNSQPLYGARVTAFQPGVDFATGTTDGAGYITLPFHPDSVGTLKLTVTGFDCRPYQATIAVTAAPVAVMDIDAPAVDDDTFGGTLGNADGKVDAGETVDLQIAVRNNGGLTAPSVVGTLVTSDPAVSVPVSFAAYGALAAGGTAYPSSDFRLTVPYAVEDQHEIPFELHLADGTGRTVVRKFQVTVHAPELRQYGHTISDPSGNNNGRPDPGEIVTMTVKVRNDGTGRARGVYARLRRVDALDPGVDVFDSTATLPDLAAGQEASSDNLSLRYNSTSGVAMLYLYDEYGLQSTLRIDPNYPTSPVALASIGAATTIKLQWQHSPDPDLMGYQIYRAMASGGPYTKVNAVPTDRTSYYLDEGLASLTRYYYKVAAIDTSGNESALSPVSSASTNPPLHAIFPIPMGRETPSSVAVDHLYPGFAMDIVGGSDLLYVWHSDGTSPVDADGASSTSGDFSKRGSYYAAGPSIGDLDGDHVAEIVAPSWDSTAVYTFDLAGNVRPGWPLYITDNIWSSAALGDLDNDGKLEMVFGSNGNKLYAMRENGTELLDGDSNPATKGVFKVLGASYNFGTAAIADLDGNGQRDIIYGGADGWLYAWRPNGTNLPGFPRFMGGSITSSVAVGYLDGPSDTQLDIVVGSNIDSLWAVRADGSRRWGKWVRLAGSSKQPSPALADINNDGYLDIVQPSTNGGIYVYDRNGNLVFPWANIRYSPLTSGASESSPIVADINGDGINDVIMGDETGTLSAFAGNNAQMLNGFPIVLNGEVRGTPAVCDCDADGMTEIVLSGWDKNLYVWDYNFPFNPNGQAAWPQFHHDARRTGFVGSPAFVGVDDPEGATAGPARIELSAPAPNPSRTGSLVTFGVPSDAAGQDYELAVFDLSGRRVKLIESGVAKVGRHTARWSLDDAAGRRVSDGVYFLRFSLGLRAESQKMIVLR